MSNTAFCPECDARINVGRNPTEGQVVVCPRCRTELEIISVDPIELDWMLDDSDDYDEDEDDDNDDDWE